MCACQLKFAAPEGRARGALYLPIHSLGDGVVLIVPMAAAALCAPGVHVEALAAGQPPVSNLLRPKLSWVSAA